MDPERAKLIDELGAIQTRLAPFAGDIARQKALKDKIRTWPAIDKWPADEAVAYSGKKFLVTLGLAENERKIRSMATVFKLVGRTQFIHAAKLTLAALTGLVGESALADLLVTERTGPRPLTIAERTQ